MGVTGAGMPGPFHLLAQGCRILEIPGLPAGLFSEAQYDMLTLTLQPGDSVLFCTDGITEAFNIEDDSFGVLRLKSLCQNALRTPPLELLSRIFASLEALTLGREQYADMAAPRFSYS